MIGFYRTAGLTDPAVRIKSLLFLSLLLLLPLQAGVRHIAAVPAAAVPESLNVWVFFTDKNGIVSAGNGLSGSPYSLSKSGPEWSKNTAVPVTSTYLNRVRSYGGVLRHCFKWDNAASFRIPVTALRKIRSLSCVRHVSLVGKRRSLYRRREGGAVAKALRNAGVHYGSAYTQLAMLRIPEAHRYLALRNPASMPGEDILIAFFDSGFRCDHRCLRHLHERDAIVACYDFIDRDTSVADPDSVNDDRDHPLWGNDHHGTEVMSTVAALDTPWYCGAAWGGRFLLARTEDAFFDSTTGLEHELHTEEDNWAAAVVWAESLGVDIISSSLGYRYDFQDTVIIDRGEGISDTIVDYLKSDLDGRTTIVSRAARYAVERGIIVVNAAGNEQFDGDTSLGAPADVDGVIAVGAVTPYGKLASFSSLGPSADGRLKPDLVAPGSSIYLPDVLNPTQIDYSSISSGTSYATPLVAGICGLVQQAHPLMGAEQLREQLYRYCRLLPEQTAPDNAYGRGIPDAVRSCMSDRHELFIVAMDTGSVPLSGVTVTGTSGDTLGKTSSGGTLSRIVDSSTTTISFTSGKMQRHLPIGKLPFFGEVVPCSLLIRVVDEQNKPVGRVKASVLSSTSSWTLDGDSTGTVRVTSFFPQDVSVVLSKPGYGLSDTLETGIYDSARSYIVVMDATERPLFEVFPTVVRKSRADRLHIRFAPVDVIPEPVIHACIRSLTGAVVWRKDVLSLNAPVTLQWNVATNGGGSIAPGTYFLLLSCNDRQYRKKILIAE